MKRMAGLAFVLAAIVGGCAAQGPVNEMASAPGQPAAETQAPPSEKHEVAAQCWMKYDKSTANLDAKAKLVDKCIADRMKGKS